MDDWRLHVQNWAFGIVVIDLYSPRFDPLEVEIILPQPVPTNPNWALMEQPVFRLDEVIRVHSGLLRTGQAKIVLRPEPFVSSFAHDWLVTGASSTLPFNYG